MSLAESSLYSGRCDQLRPEPARFRNRRPICPESPETAVSDRWSLRRDEDVVEFGTGVVGA